MERYKDLLLKIGFLSNTSKKVTANEVYTYGRFGTLLKNNLIEFWKRSLPKNIYRIETPIITKKEVLEKSGHIKHFTEDVYFNLISGESIPFSKTKKLIVQDHKIKIKNDRGKNLKEWIKPFKYKMENDYTELYLKFYKPVSIVKGLLKPGELSFVSNFPNYDLTFPSYGIVDPLNEAPFLKKLYQHQGMLSTSSKPISVEDNIPIWNNQYIETREMPNIYEDDLYLRPETAQGAYCNYPSFLNDETMNKPFGLAQIGRSFRNEMRMERMLFRCKEFDQLELQYFVPKNDAEYWYQYWINKRFNWWKSLLNKHDDLRLVVKDDLAHYSAACTDIEYQFPWGWEEIEGVALRNDYDLSNFHHLYSDKIDKNDLHYVVETSAGVGRGFMAILNDSMMFKSKSPDRDPLLKLNAKIAPVKVSIATLLDKEDLKELGYKVQKNMGENSIESFFDKRNVRIGKKYYKADLLGAPKAVCLDDQSLEDFTATIRDRDSGLQKRIPLVELVSYIRNNVIYPPINLDDFRKSIKQ